jgi:hypothetical protein
MSDEQQEGHEIWGNGVLIEHRHARGWGRGRLASEFERIGRELGISTPARAAMEKAIYRHETGKSQVTDEVYLRLYCAAFSATTHQLFGDLTALGATPASTFNITSHKFMPVYLGLDEIEKLKSLLSGQSDLVEWAECWSTIIDHPHGKCTVYGFPWGSLVYHLEEKLSMALLAEVAVWRKESYERELEWTAKHVYSVLGSDRGGAEYILTAFWMQSPKWDGVQLETAMKLLCTPRVLIDHGSDQPSVGHAELIEQAMLRAGYENQGIVEFGVHGISHGYASWAGVSYFPLAARRALPAELLVGFEIVVQALWSYCQHVRAQVEAGSDPVVPSGYGWRWLRGVRSRLSGARPQETAQQAVMRAAILQTSELHNHLTATLEILRDTDPER